MLYPPVLLQSSPAIWLPKNGIAADEAHELKKYWGMSVLIIELSHQKKYPRQANLTKLAILDLDAFYEEGIPTQHLNLL
jgi:hypothetical protein